MDEKGTKMGKHAANAGEAGPVSGDVSPEPATPIRANGYLWTGTEWVPDPAARTETSTQPQSPGESNVQRTACPRCGEMIAVKAQVCRYCGHEGGPSIKRFVGADMSGMSSARRTFNVVGFALLILTLLIVFLGR